MCGRISPRKRSAITRSAGPEPLIGQIAGDNANAAIHAAIEAVAPFAAQPVENAGFEDFLRQGGQDSFFLLCETQGLHPACELTLSKPDSRELLARSCVAQA